MKTMIVICIDETIDKPLYNADIQTVRDVDTILTIYTNSKCGLEELLSNKKDIETALKREDDEMSYYAQQEHIEYVIPKSYKELIDNLVYIEFDASNREYDPDLRELTFETIDDDYTPEERVPIIKDYLYKHPEYKKQTIVVPDIIDDNTDLDSIKDYYKDYKKIYIHPSGEEPMDLDDANAGINLNTVIDEINELGLSPLEKVILVYDLVKEKPYMMEKSSESAYESRTTYRALLGDSIVCLGYSNIMNTLFDGLGIVNKIDRLDNIDNTPGGHARNIIHLKDDKYEIDGIFVIDATIDSRLKDDDYNYLYKYVGFLKPVRWFNKTDIINGLKDHTMGYYNTHNIDDMDELYDDVNISIFTTLGNPENKDKRLFAINTLKSIAHLALDDEKVYDMEIDEITELVKNKEKLIKSKLKVSIDAYTLLRALTVVRVLENKMDPNKYPLDFERLFKAPVFSSFDLDEERHLGFIPPEQRMLDLLYGTDSKIDTTGMSEEDIRKLIADNYIAEYRYFVRYIMREDKKNHKVIKSINIYDKGGKKNDTKGSRN